ncbi:HAD superfamily hydrolase (TIGR01509 family)/HAD superfamily hydrolase (TIGR01549 family) [Frondihabitans sp. PhB188]|uniref:HAD family hydrolase n=1 Tax=Frondihabitans sp. PhB188 TaxID=2485200 RepID=UPI000FB38221|nr:HAD family hydrolase [Frondihabitans sp. PhB188]ROQ37245.1 HAD superfamily hydrolase (TIGR01509 family)/HAD superfamily hydrolase (TIGR01549 family) [Frondihabitans sp. PhB188]
MLFDLDGTLVDSNFLHVEAWDHAFTSAGLTVPSWRIQQVIGADSSVLMDTLAGDAPEAVQNAAKKLHDERLGELAPRLQVLDQSDALVAAIAAHGTRVVLATSAPQNELDRILDILHIEEDTYAVTSSEDVEKAKPEPDIISVALQKGGVEAAGAIMVGDSVWDMRSATKAGVRGVGLLSGGTGEALLRQAGAIEVFDDAASLLAALETSILATLWKDDAPE